MKVVVNRSFKLKPLNKRYRKGEVFESSDKSLIDRLKNEGFLGRVISEPLQKIKTLPPVVTKPDDISTGENESSSIEGDGQSLEGENQPIYLGGGWYQLSDGRKVRKSELESD